MHLEGIAQPAPRPDPLPVQDLEVYEQCGGHTLRRHVFTRPGDELRRIRRERIAAAGRFLSLGTAQRALRFAIDRRRDDVRAWLRGRDRHAPFTFVVDTGTVVGHTLTWEDVARGMTAPRATTALRVVLRRREDLPGGFMVVTAYPTRVPRRRANSRIGGRQ